MDKRHFHDLAAAWTRRAIGVNTDASNDRPGSYDGQLAAVVSDVYAACAEELTQLTDIEPDTEMARAEAQLRFLSMRQQRDDVLDRFASVVRTLGELQAARADFKAHRLDTEHEDSAYARRYKRCVDAEERWMNLPDQINGE